ncbi:MAG TPA: DegT/DnrJ/EryC1/StrS family aminotransferase, partial [Candidatus Pacearchaeota archaeon]|nr:DegT/DnrJ/EryC1/StrS family aminotransferase [Candidatus Pacearchaeota archaeon]
YKEIKMNKRISFKKIGNESIGFLSFFEANKDIPFDIKRIYYTYNVPIETKRGMHAHDVEAIVTDNEKIADKIRMLRNYGSRRKYYNEIEGVNSRLDEMQAALLNVKLSHYIELRSEREKIAQKYLNEIKNPKIILPKIRKGAEHVWHLFVVQTENRDKLQNYLNENGIGTQIHYPIPPHLSEAYKYLGYKKGDFSICVHFLPQLPSL